MFSSFFVSIFHFRNHSSKLFFFLRKILHCLDAPSSHPGPKTPKFLNSASHGLTHLQNHLIQFSLLSISSVTVSVSHQSPPQSSLLFSGTKSPDRPPQLICYLCCRLAVRRQLAITDYMASRKTTSGNRLDVGWQHGIDIENTSRKVQCKYCQKIFSGGIYRFKHHLACTRKDVEPCHQVPADVKQMMLNVLVKNLEASEKKRKASLFFRTGEDADEDFEISSINKGKKPFNSTQFPLGIDLRDERRLEDVQFGISLPSVSATT